jgi:hypothetical protein
MQRDVEGRTCGSGSSRPDASPPTPLFLYTIPDFLCSLQEQRPLRTSLITSVIYAYITLSEPSRVFEGFKAIATISNPYS